MSAAAPLDTVERVSTTEHVLRSLRAAIVDGSLPQGEKLREIPLARQLGTGRSAVREALRQLLQEGLVQHEVHRGTFVRVIDSDDIVDVYRAREAVETAAVEAILAGEGVDLAPLRAALERLRAAAAGGEGTWLEMADVDLRFHETLVTLAGSQRLIRMYATLAAESRMLLYTYPSYSALQNVADHEQILVALERRSPEALDFLREHLRFSARLALEGRG
jgi:DNA-binding GntR family transcriptional regulator